MKTRSDAGKRYGNPAVLLFSLLFFLAMAPVDVGNAAGGVKLTLKEAVNAALKDNHELQAQRNAHAAKQAEVGIARSALLPKISLEERFLRTASPAYAFMTKLSQERIVPADFVPDTLNHPPAINDFQTAITVEQPLFIRKAGIGLEMSRTEAAASEESLRRKMEEVAFRVVHRYLSAGTAGEFTAVAQKALEDALEHQRLAEVRYGAGLGLYSDTLRAATAVAEARQRLVSAGKNRSVAQRALGLVIGSAEAVEVETRPPALPLRNIDSLRLQAQARSDIRSLELRTENARNNINLAQAGYYPLLGAGGTYQFNDHNHPLGGEGEGWQMMAFLRWELFDGARTRHEKIRASHQASEAEEYLKAAKKMVSFQVDEAWLTLEEAGKNRELAEEEFKSAEEGRRLVRVRYENALSPMVDLLDAQVSFDRARANRVARENEYNLAVAALSLAGGTILEDLNLAEQEGKAR